MFDYSQYNYVCMNTFISEIIGARATNFGQNMFY